MKKITVLFSVMLTAVLLFSSCGGNKTPNGENGVTTTREAPSAQRNEITQDPDSGAQNSAGTIPTDAAGQAVYEKPVDKQALDLDEAKDISTADMQFTYDDWGRISTCKYRSADGDIELEYSYPEDGGIALFGFCGGSMIVDTVYYPTKGFDKSLGFTAYDGYYFFGYSFSS